jgi:hypothetical protein
MPRTIPPLLFAAVLALGCTPDDTPGYSDGWLDSDLPADASGTDTWGGCTSSAPYCSADRTMVMQCNPTTGEVTTLSTCGAGEACVGGACTAVACVPLSASCMDEHTRGVCRDDGSGYDAHECPPEQICNEETGGCEPPCLLRIFILLDQSGSMGSTDGPSKWDQAREALGTLMTGETAEDVEFGFGVFPTDSDCATDDVVIHPVPAATPELVDDYFADNPPSGMTPLVDAMGHFRTDMTANLNDPSYHNALLLVSDGSDTCYEDCSHCGPFDFVCQETCEENFDELILAQLAHHTEFLRDEMQIRTFVIGFGSGVSDEELSTIAENGGTVLGDWIQADDVSDLETAFQTILDEMYECNPIMI